MLISTASIAPAPIQVLLIEEHTLVRTALHALLDGTPGLRVVAEARQCSHALPLLRTHRPDVVLVGGRRDHHTDDASIVALRNAAPWACVLLLSGEGPGGEAKGVAGASGWLPSEAGALELRAVVASVLGGGCSTCAIRAHCPAPQIAVALSRRERQVAVRVADGMMSKQIAVSLGVSLRTVHTYRESLARKLGASSAAVITRFVLESGLTDATSSDSPARS